MKPIRTTCAAREPIAANLVLSGLAFALLLNLASILANSQFAAAVQLMGR